MVVGSTELPFFSDSLKEEAKALLMAEYSKHGGRRSSKQLIDAIAGPLPAKVDDSVLVGRKKTEEAVIDVLKRTKTGFLVDDCDHFELHQPAAGHDIHALSATHPHPQRQDTSTTSGARAAQAGALLPEQVQLQSVEQSRPAAGQHPKGELHLRQSQPAHSIGARGQRPRQHDRQGVSTHWVKPSSAPVLATPSTTAAIRRTDADEDEDEVLEMGNFFLPMDVALDRSVRAHLRAQVDLLEKACFDLCVNRLGIVCHFQVLSQFMLFGSGMYEAQWLDNFVQLVAKGSFPFGLLPAHQHAARTAGLDELVASDSFGYRAETAEEPHDQDPTRVSGSASGLPGGMGTDKEGRAAPPVIPGARSRRQPGSMTGSTLLREVVKALSLLQPIYDFSAAGSHLVLQTFFPDDVLGVYVRVHDRLLHAQMGLYFLKRIWKQVLNVKERGLPSSAQANVHETHSPSHASRLLLTSRDLRVFGHELLIFIQLLIAYYKSDVVHVSWKNFMVCSSLSFLYAWQSVIVVVAAAGVGCYCFRRCPFGQLGVLVT